MKLRITISILLVLASVIFAQESMFNNFVTASGSRLMDGDREIRFISFNIPNLNYVEDEFGYTTIFPFRMPDTYELTDAFKSILQLGGGVIRNYTIPVRIGKDDYPTYVLAPGIFDEQSFKAMDTMLYLANKLGVRVILPFVNNWQWMGGRPQYADFRGKTQEEFWTDRQLIDDVKETIRFTINRVNTVTGVKYSDDKSILCWETGNELTAPYSWTKEICAYIKSLDKNHLVMDGFFATGAIPVMEESMSDPNIDIVSSHHYEDNPDDILVNVARNVQIVNNRKPYVIGEFGFFSTPATEKVLDYFIKNPISGALIWSLRHHRREGGFYWHSEPLGMGLYKAYHHPGFASGNEYDEINLLSLMQKKAFEIQGRQVPPVRAPEAPLLLPITDPMEISWQGSAGASAYDIERAESIEGPWRTIGYNVSDAEAQYLPLFSDKDIVTGQEYYYRITAKNAAGPSAASNIAGPVKANSKFLVDDMINFGSLYHKKGNIILVSGDDRVYREKMFRLQGDEDDEIFYMVNGNLTSFRLYSFSQFDESTLQFSLSGDNEEYEDIKPERKSLYTGRDEYGYWAPSVYSYNIPEGSRVSYLKINFEKKTQLGRLELRYN